jgi:hypothetical protein
MPGIIRFFPILFICILIRIPSISHSQNAPLTTAATIGNAVPGPVDIPVTVTGFTAISAVSLSLDYDYSVMHFTGGTPNPLLPSFPTGEVDLGTGFRRISMGWFGTATTLANGSTIMTLHFTYIDGITGLSWYDNGPSCEYADANFNVLNDIPQESFYFNGHVCGPVGNPGEISGTETLCAGESAVNYSILPVENATGYTWTVPENVIIINGQNTNAITVDFQANAASGNISVMGTNACGNGPLSSLTVTVGILPVANAGNDLTINYGTSTTLHAAPGGNGSYSYHWSPEELLVDPYLQDPQTVILTQTQIFTVLVTNLETLCQASDQVTVSITGGPLSANPVAIPALVCQGGSSQLFANPGGGSGNYSYLWTCIPPGIPPWSSSEGNPVVTPDSSKIYNLVLNDGFTTVNESTAIMVSGLPSASISGGDTLCGQDTFTNLQVDLTGTPPWSFTYTYGNTSVFINDVTTTPYYIIASDPGDYIVSAVEDAYCNGSSNGIAIVRKYPIPATPEISVYGTELISSSCCGNQWYKNGDIIPGANGQTYQVTVTGEYFVTVTLNSCSSEPSEPVDIIVGIPEYRHRSLFISPNPAKDRIAIFFNDYPEEITTLHLYSSTGILIKNIPVASSEEGSITIDISGYPDGFYFIILKTADGLFTGKVIKNH